jgi:hypothetical protein
MRADLILTALVVAARTASDFKFVIGVVVFH